MGAEETPASSKKTDRREFLKQGAALAGGAVGVMSQSASGQLAGPEAFIQGSDDMVAYGSRVSICYFQTDSSRRKTLPRHFWL